jgi:transketolase
MFSEYARNALRMAALMKINPLFVFTHDSIGLGEDGPTHQPVEQIATLRLIPNMNVWRPCDTLESLIAWGESLARQDGPSTLIFSRQNLPFIQREAPQIEDIKRGGYVLRDADEARAVIIATGSEVELALKAQQQLADEGLAVRVVSMPCTRLFDQQTRSYIEAGVTDYWRKYVGLTGEVVGIDSFGESAPASVLFEHFGITSAAVVKAVKAVL